MHSKMEAGAMAALFKKFFSVYRVLEKAEATTQRDMARLAQLKREAARRESRTERGWQVLS